MKKILFILAAILTFSFSVDAVKMKDLKIYINPGHGGYSSDDRPMHVYPFAVGDTAGFWESSSNLYKGLHMYHMLDSLGTTAYLSRIKNREEDDRSLYSIGVEATNLGVDMFFSIHSNAGESVNYPLMLYRENSVGVPRYEENVEISNILWDNLHSNQMGNWTRNSRYCSGDLTFYPSWGTSGLGVLRNLYTPGLLSEGGMHEHRPECHRLLNDDYRWLEAWHFVKSIMEFFNTEDRFVTGNVAGICYDDNNTREYTLALNLSAYGIDRKKPLCGAYIELRDLSGNVVQKRTTDGFHNGVFVFRNVAPGNYKVVANCEGYYEMSYDVTVTANEVSYQNFPMHLRRETPLEVVSYSPNVAADEFVNSVEPIVFNFNHDISQEAFEKAFKIEPAVEGDFTYSESFHVVTFKPKVAYEKSTKYTVTLTTDLCTPDPYYDQAHLASNFVFEFTTKDRNKLELIQSFPEEGSLVHYTKPQLEFRFDKKLSTAGITSNVKVYDENGSTVGIATRSCAYNKLNGEYGNAIIALSSNLTIGGKYKVVLSPEIKDVDGVPLSQEVVINFIASDQAQEVAGNIIDECESKEIFVNNTEESTGLESDCVFYTMTGNKLFGSASFRATYSFLNNKDGVVVLDYTGDMKKANRGEKVGVYVNGDLNNHELQLGFTAGTDTKYFKVCNMDFAGWRYYEFTLDTLEPNVEYLFSNVKLVQSEGVYSQKGGFNLDNIINLGSSGVESAVVDKNTSVYVDDANTVHISTLDELLSVEIISAQGALIKKAYTETVDCSSLAPGVYLVKVQTVNRDSVKQIVIK